MTMIPHAAYCIVTSLLPGFKCPSNQYNCIAVCWSRLLRGYSGFRSSLRICGYLERKALGYFQLAKRK